MILTYKIKHQYDFSLQLKQAKQVAEFAIANRDKLSSKYVKHIGLKSAIANQILRKYGRNKNCKKINKVKLVADNQSVKYNKTTITIRPLKISFQHQIPVEFSKINQIELDNEYFYVSVTVKEQPKIKEDGWIGIDRNTTGHCVVASCTR